MALHIIFLKSIHFCSGNDGAQGPKYIHFITPPFFLLSFLVLQLIYLDSLGINMSLTNESYFTYSSSLFFLSLSNRIGQCIHLLACLCGSEEQAQSFVCAKRELY